MPADPPRTLYVAPIGHDDNAGTEGAPFRTIQKAADRARAGDTILVRGGVYRERVILRYAGQEHRPITLKNYPGERPVIQPGLRGQEPLGQGVLIQDKESHLNAIGWITIEGFEIRYGWDGIKFYNTHDLIIRDNYIHGSFHQGILGTGNRVLIERNVIAENGTNPEREPNQLQGIYGTGSTYIIINNLIHSNTAYGIQVAAYGYEESRHAGPEYSGAKDWFIGNNTIALNKHRAGVVLWQPGVENCVIQNNIFYRNGEQGDINGIKFYNQGGKQHLVKNNIFFPSGESLVSAEPDAYQESGNKKEDPRLADPKAFDFRLRAGSPALGGGTRQGAPRVDIEGRQRQRDARVDIGAYESEHTPDDETPDTGSNDEPKKWDSSQRRLILIGAVILVLALLGVVLFR